MQGTAYDLTGPEGAPVVVLVHGLGLNRACWRWLVPDLSRDFRVLAYDLPGHGASAPPAPNPDLSTLGAHLVGLMDALGIDRAALVGFSLGGMVVRRVAQDHPDRVAALAILHSPHRRSPEAQAAVRARVEQVRAQGPQATVAAALERWFTDAAPTDLLAEVRGWVLANDPAVYPQIYAILAEGVEEIADPVPPVACPTLILTADQDAGNSPDMARAIAAGIAGAEVVILPGLQHMALAEDPAAVNKPLTAFLRRRLLTNR
jgi:(E)-2-((N-methylformamido)methylene)succinate hydrolase